MAVGSVASGESSRRALKRRPCVSTAKPHRAIFAATFSHITHVHAGAVRRIVRRVAEAPAQSRKCRPEERCDIGLRTKRAPAPNISMLSNRTTMRFRSRSINVPDKGAIAFSPLTMGWAEIAARDLLMIRDGIVLPNGIKLTQPYVFGALPEARTELLRQSDRPLYLAVPGELQSSLGKYASELFGPNQTAADKAETVSQHFQTEFDYSLELPSARGRDPIIHFLSTRHAAHCEYFATATCLLLRSAGVPTRYVTGYVAAEMNDGGDYWIARNRDAHAWVEAYDDENQRWFAIESTPGRRYQTAKRSDVDKSISSDNLTTDDETGNTQAGDWWRQARAWLGSVNGTNPLILILRFAQLPLLALLTLALWIRHQRSATRVVDRDDKYSWKQLAKVERQLRRKHSLQRAPTETLHQFARRVDESADDTPGVDHAGPSQETKERRRLGEWLRQYAIARYQGMRPPRMDMVFEPSGR